MRFAGIDIAAETHFRRGRGRGQQRRGEADQLRRGRNRVREAAHPAGDVLGSHGSDGALLGRTSSPRSRPQGTQWRCSTRCRTRRFAGEDLERTKTDAIDALGIARFAAQKRPVATRLPDSATQELRELVRFRDRLHAGLRRPRAPAAPAGRPGLSRVHPVRAQPRQRARLGHPPRVPEPRRPSSACPGSALPSSVTTAGIRSARRSRKGLVEAAKTSVGRHHGPAYRVQVRCACEDLRCAAPTPAHELDSDIERTLEDHEVGTLPDDTRRHRSNDRGPPGRGAWRHRFVP